MAHRAPLRGLLPKLVGVDLIAVEQQQWRACSPATSRQSAFLSAIFFMSPGSEKPLQPKA
jgi:hypothetical protein